MAVLVVFGSREFSDYELVSSIIGRTALYQSGAIECLVSGTARGADRLGERWAEEHGIEIKRFPADWDRYGKRAGFVRNELMANYCTHAIGFWDGESRGTKGMRDYLVKIGRPTLVVDFLTGCLDLSHISKE